MTDDSFAMPRFCLGLRGVVTLALLILAAGCLPKESPKTITNRTSPPNTAPAKSPAVKSKSPSTCTQNDSFSEAVNKALSAATLSQSAKSVEDWELVVLRWSQAVQGMQAVPPSDPRRAFAEKKALEYLEYMNAALAKAATATRSQLPFSTFNNEFLDEQLRLYLSYVATLGPPDVLIVGSSRALLGIDAKAMQQALATKGRDLKVYNFGVNGATAQVVNLLVRQILSPQQLPQLILWADGVRGFNSGRVDKTYNGIVASPGYKDLSTGIRPSLPPRKLEVSEPCARTQDSTRLPVATSQSKLSPIQFALAPTAVFRGIGYTPTEGRGGRGSRGEYCPCSPCFSWPPLPQPGPRVPPALEAVLDSFENRSIWGNHRRDACATGIAPAPAIMLQSEWDSCCQPKVTFVLAAANASVFDIDSNGFLPVFVRYDPDTYYQKNPRIAGLYDADYQPFNLGGNQAAALNSLRAYTQSRQIPLVFINLPLTRDYLDSLRRKHEQQFREFMQQRATQQKFVFLDLGTQWLTRYENFADSSHLNRFGAAAIARQLAADSRIPWPRSRP